MYMHKPWWKTRGYHWILRISLRKKHVRMIQHVEGHVEGVVADRDELQQFILNEPLDPVSLGSKFNLGLWDASCGPQKTLSN